ncbi:MAG: hypothetical protein DDT34_02041 [Firmicutes bacterium]|nr:hypothetical protein [Bacillota bacterium]
MANFLISTAISVGLGMLQRALTPDTRVEVEGTRVASSQITTAAEGSVIPRVYRRFRVGGQLIWATSFREEISVAPETGDRDHHLYLLLFFRHRHL